MHLAVARYGMGCRGNSKSPENSLLPLCQQHYACFGGFVCPFLVIVKFLSNLFLILLKITVGKYSPQLKVELYRFGGQFQRSPLPVLSFNARRIHTNMTNVAQTVLIVQIFCAAGLNVSNAALSLSVVCVTAERAGCIYFSQIMKICCCQI